jgi:GrpB-like predicted nucleotidyltransferase (UPF0157 family)
MDDVLIGGIEKRGIVVVDYDACWPAKFQRHAEILSRALGDKALVIEHVGSTSVPGLAAKPIIDIIILVEDPADEAAYLPALVEAGYVLRVREPDWHQHRMFRTPELDVHVHIYSQGCVEVTRQLAFRDCLRANVEDRLVYEAVKRKLAKEEWPDMNAYARAKTEVVEQITARALLEAGNEGPRSGGANQPRIWSPPRQFGPRAAMKIFSKQQPDFPALAIAAARVERYVDFGWQTLTGPFVARLARALLPPHTDLK